MVAVMDVMHSCGCCLRCPADRDLTTPYTHLGTTEIYSNMLKESLDLHVILDGDGSCGICSACVGRLRDASDFKLQVQRSQAQLRARLQGALLDRKPVVKPETDCDSAGDESIFNVFDEEPIEKSDPEDEAGGELLHEDPLKSEPADDVTSDGDSSPLSQLRLRMKSEGLEQRVSALAREPLSTTGSVRLDEATLHKSSRVTPIKETHDNTAGLRAQEAYTCDTCGKHFTGKSSLIAHVRRHLAQHESPATYSCVTKQFKARNILIGRYSCGVCNKTFRKSTDFKRHKRIHTGEKPYKCDECDRKFARKFTLDEHKRRRHTGKKQFKAKSTLLKRIRRHYSCGVCDKTFRKSTDYKRHKRIHTGEKPYKCEDCDKTFARKFTLDEHKRRIHKIIRM